MADANTIKVVVLGAGAQGKSALIIKFVSGIFVDEYDPTIEDNYSSLIVVDEEPILLEILDTAGQEEYASMSDQWMEEGQIFILVYSVGSQRESNSPHVLTPYQQCEALKLKLTQVKDEPNIPIILCGSQCDLPDSQRNWSYEDGLKLAEELGCSYIEVSAKDDTNLDKLWDLTAKSYLKYVETQGTSFITKFSISTDRSRGDTLISNKDDDATCCSCFNFGGGGSKSKSTTHMQSSITINTDTTANSQYDQIQTSTPKNDDIIEDINDETNRKSPYAKIDSIENIEIDTMEPKKSHSGHTRITTESEMTPIGKSLAEEPPEEKEIMKALDDIQERENENIDDELDPNQIAQIVIDDNNDKEQKGKSPSIDGDSIIHESGDTSQPTPSPVLDEEKDGRSSNGIDAPNPEPVNSFSTKIRDEANRKKSAGRYKSPKISVGSDFGQGAGRDNKHEIKLFPVHKLPKDDVFEPILSSKNWRIRRRFYFKRFIISILCGCFLPIVLIIQTLAFLFYIEGKRGGFYYPSNVKYSDIHHGILFDFLGIVIGRKPDQDPEIKKDRKWFLRQTWLQKVLRIILTIFICVLYYVCFHNVEAHWDDTLRVSLMETLGPILLLAALWIMLSLWIAHESNIKPSIPPLTRLRKINLYFGAKYDQTTSAYKFLRGYLASTERQWHLSYFNVTLLILLAGFYASIPGLTRATVGDPSLNLRNKKFITAKEWEVEVGALVFNTFLMSALMFIMEVQYSKHMEHYRVWMYELTMFLMMRDNSNGINDKYNSILGDEFDDDSEDDMSYDKEGKHFPKDLFLSFKRRSNALGWLEIRSFLSTQGKLFFGEQELPIIWVLMITCGLTIFVVYRVFAGEGSALQSVLFNGVAIMTLICLAALIRIMLIAAKFEDLQQRQESLIETQKFTMRCDKAFNTELSDDEDDDVKEQEIRPLVDRNNPRKRGKTSILSDEEEIQLKMELTWYQRNVAFINDTLAMVHRKDITPKLYKTKLNTVLIPSIGLIVTAAIVVLLKLFVKILLGDAL